MNTQQRIYKLATKVLKIKNASDEYIDFRKVKLSESMMLRTLTGIDFRGYIHCIDGSGINHAMRHHNITVNDIMLVPFILDNYDFIGLGKKKNTIVYKKLIGKEYFYVEEIRTGRKKLTIKTLYKRKRRQK